MKNNKINLLFVVVCVAFALVGCEGESPTEFGNPVEAAQVMAQTIGDNFPPLETGNPVEAAQVMAETIAEPNVQLAKEAGQTWSGMMDIMQDNCYIINGQIYPKANWRCAATKVGEVYDVYCLSKHEGGGDRSWTGVTFINR